MTEEKFSSPGNRLLGGIGAALGLAAVIAMLAYGPGRSELVAIFAIVFAVTLIWAFLIRPEIRLSETALTLRNPLATVAVPIQKVMRVDVRRFTIVELDEGGLTSPAMSRMAMQIAKADRGGTINDGAEFMLARVRARMDESALVPLPEGADIRRTPALVELGVLATCAVAVVVLLLV